MQSGASQGQRQTPTPWPSSQPLALRASQVAFFFVKVIAVYVLLVAAWPVARSAYTPAFCAMADLSFWRFGSAGRVDFRPIDPPSGNNSALDFDIRLENIRTRQTGTFELERNSRNMAYLPMAFTAALILATPVPWRRRLTALLAGLCLISAFIGLQLALHLLNVFSNPDPLNQFALAPWSKTLVQVSLKVAVLSPVTAYIAPVFVWVLVAFRRDDWKALAGPATVP